MPEFIYKEEGYKILGACFEVYKEKGCGFLEGVYQECLEMEFELQGIPFISQSKLNLQYKGQSLTQQYISDFVCYEKIIVEIKAVKELCDEHRAQLFNYLKATGLKVGYLINFGHYPKLEHERIIQTKVTTEETE